MAISSSASPCPLLSAAGPLAKTRKSINLALITGLQLLHSTSLHFAPLNLPFDSFSPLRLSFSSYRVFFSRAHPPTICPYRGSPLGSNFCSCLFHPVKEHTSLFNTRPRERLSASMEIRDPGLFLSFTVSSPIIPFFISCVYHSISSSRFRLPKSDERTRGPLDRQNDSLNLTYKNYINFIILGEKNIYVYKRKRYSFGGCY